MKFSISYLLCFLSAAQLNAQVMRQVKAPYTRTNAYSKEQTDVFSFSVNQASLASLKNSSLGIYGERRFMMEDLSVYQINLALLTKPGNFGLCMNRFGGKEYNETAINLAYARKLDSKLDLGIQFNYYGIHAGTYGKASVINAETGVIFHPSEKLNMGVHLYNPVGMKLGKGDEELPAIYSFGWGWDASEKFYLGCEIQKEEGQPVNINTGLQYQFEKKIFARLGISSSPSSFYVGTGIQLNKLRVDATVSIHPHLGLSPGLMILYNSTN